MKTTYLVLVMLFVICIASSCKKNNEEDNIEEKEFAIPIWTWGTDQSFQFSSGCVPAIDQQNNSYYVVQTESGLNLLSLDQDGNTRWLISGPFSGLSSSSRSVILSGNRLFFHSGRTVYCFNNQNGEEVWQFEVDFPASAINNFLVKESRVWLTYSKSGEIILQKLNSDGVEEWSAGYQNYSTNLGMSAIGENLILLNKDLYAYHVDVLSVSLIDGSINWKTIPDIESAGSDPVIDSEGNVYFSTYEGELVAIDGDNGTVIWTFKGNEFTKSPQFGNSQTITVLPNNDILYPSGDLYCFDRNGNEKWRHPFQSYMSTVIGSNGIIYGWGGYNEDNYSVSLYAIYASNGEVISNESSTIDNDLSFFTPLLSINYSGNIVAVGYNKIHCISSLSSSLETNGWSKAGKGYENNCVR